jgi:hypothetical protein
MLSIPCEVGKVSDGYHTFDELYDHRCHLFSALINLLSDISWWSKLHHDGTSWEGWIIAGIDLPTGTVTYHMPEVMIHLLPKNRELEKGKKWDGHTSNDVINRLAEFCEMNPRENESLTDILDLMRDEFKHIMVCTDSLEVIGSCDRAIKNINQNVPIIVQRDNAEAKLAKIKSLIRQLGELL